MAYLVVVDVGPRDAAPYLGVAARGGTAAAKALVGSRAANEPAASRCRAPARQGQGPGAGAVGFSVGNDLLARGLGWPAHIAVRAAPGPSRPSRREAEGEWPEEWFLVERPEDEEQPTKYCLSTLPESVSHADLVDATKLRWRTERDYHGLKQEVGLGHYEG